MSEVERRSRRTIWTPRKQRFVDVVARTNDPAYAAHKSGYVQSAGSVMSRTPVIMEAVEAVRARLRTEGAAVGLGVLLELAQDNACPPGVRRAAASDLLKLSGVAAGLDGETTKQLADMTLAELDEERARVLRILSDNAQDITPPSPNHDAQDAPHPAPVPSSPDNHDVLS